MSCREKDSLVSGGREAEFTAHSAGCPECAALGRQMDEIAAVTRALAAPAMTQGLRASLLTIPRRTVSCEGADLLLAQVFEAEIAAQDEARWKSHLSRCFACSEAAEALFAARGLAAPVPAQWLATRLAAASRSADASAGAKPGSAGRAAAGFWALLWSPKGAIGLAYAAAVAVMLTGFNPADLARKAGIARLEDATGVAVAAARSGAVERIGALEEKAYRAIESWKGRLYGYGRATIENALALVMRTEPRRSPDRSKSGESNGIPRTNDGASLAGKPVPSAAPITTWRT